MEAAAAAAAAPEHNANPAKKVSKSTIFELPTIPEKTRRTAWCNFALLAPPLPNSIPSKLTLSISRSLSLSPYPPVV